METSMWRCSLIPEQAPTLMLPAQIAWCSCQTHGIAFLGVARLPLRIQAP
jgi:hypothetical protein